MTLFPNLTGIKKFVNICGRIELVNYIPVAFKERVSLIK